MVAPMRVDMELAIISMLVRNISRTMQSENYKVGAEFSRAFDFLMQAIG